MAESELFQFRYVKDKPDVDLDTFLITQSNFKVVLDQIRLHTHPHAELKIKLHPFKKGSFISEHIIELTAAGIFATENLDKISTLFSFLADYIDITKFLKGGKADKVKENKDGSITLTFKGKNNTYHKGAVNVYQQNFYLNNAVVKTTRALDKDKEIDGIEIIKPGDKKPLVRLGRDDFRYFNEVNDYIKSAEKIEEEVDAVLFVKKFDVEPRKNTKFTFYYNGNPIPASIQDKSFLSKVNSGEKFGKGDSLHVGMIIYKKFSEDINNYIPYKYDIIKVKRINRAKGGRQTDLFN